MNILITGANGQLGSEFKALHALKAFENHAIFFTDIDELDIMDELAIQSFFKTHAIDCCINCAAYTAVDKAETEILLAEKINVTAPGNLAKACKMNNALLFHISTDFVFNGKNYRPLLETDPTGPISVYGQTKLEGEAEIAKFHDKYIIIRTSWLYSIYGNNFVKTMQRLGRERSELNIIFDQIGSPTYAADLAAVIAEIMIQFEPEFAGTYHYSNEGIASWYDFAHAIMNYSNIPCKVMPIETSQYPTPASRPHYSVLNKKKIKETFKLSIPHWRDSLQKCIDKLSLLS
ncbi:MAG: dTDP-4-dehydrorhamnose reductase [Bacteroidetes bacterium]|nr:dTDP-4-dehydrorhamnose reductase [Bacteroidota bacterium]